jgi:hypothetical protein
MAISYPTIKNFEKLQRHYQSAASENIINVADKTYQQNNANKNLVDIYEIKIMADTGDRNERFTEITVRLPKGTRLEGDLSVLTRDADSRGFIRLGASDAGKPGEADKVVAAALDLGKSWNNSNANKYQAVTVDKRIRVELSDDAQVLAENCDADFDNIIQKLGDIINNSNNKEQADEFADAQSIVRDMLKTSKQLRLEGKHDSIGFLYLNIFDKLKTTESPFTSSTDVLRIVMKLDIMRESANKARAEARGATLTYTPQADMKAAIDARMVDYRWCLYKDEVNDDDAESVSEHSVHSDGSHPDDISVKSSKNDVIVPENKIVVIDDKSKSEVNIPKSAKLKAKPKAEVLIKRPDKLVLPELLQLQKILEVNKTIVTILETEFYNDKKNSEYTELKKEIDDNTNDMKDADNKLTYYTKNHQQKYLNSANEITHGKYQAQLITIAVNASKIVQDVDSDEKQEGLETKPEHFNNAVIVVKKDSENEPSKIQSVDGDADTKELDDKEIENIIFNPLPRNYTNREAVDKFAGLLVKLKERKHENSYLTGMVGNLNILKNELEKFPQRNINDVWQNYIDQEEQRINKLPIKEEIPVIQSGIVVQNDEVAT